jgi:hypothetical protein
MDAAENVAIKIVIKNCLAKMLFKIQKAVKKQFICHYISQVR